MSTTYTTISTFTVTNARYLASKIAADLLQMQLFYGKPTDKQIDEYIEEVVILLLEECLDHVTYGFKRGEDWVIALKYRAATGGRLMVDDRSGGVTPGINISGTIWYSFLSYSTRMYLLPEEDRQRIHSSLPIQRSDAREPRTIGPGTFDRSYASGGVGIQRQTFINS